MLFNSPIFIFIFLPVVISGYFFLNKHRLIVAGKAWLVLASLFFYGWWNPAYLTLIMASMVVNFAVGSSLNESKLKKQQYISRKAILTVGIIFNLSLLGYYKYADFFIENTNWLFSTNMPLLRLMLPLAISFFTFQQVAYLVDCYKEKNTGI